MAAIFQSTPPVETNDRRFKALGLLVILGTFGGLGTWAAVAPLSGAAVAPGVITVENYRKTVQHLEGGIIKTIHVRDGDRVTQDQVLVTFDATQPRAQLEVLRGQYVMAAAREARLIAQRDGMDKVEFPDDLRRMHNDPRAKTSMRLQEQSFKVRRQAHDGEILLYKRQIEELQSKTKGLREQERSQGQMVLSYEAELRDFEELLRKGYAEKQKVRELERNLTLSESQRSELLANIATTEVQINETELKILQLEKELQREVASELSDVQAELFQLREKIQSLEDTVQRTTVRSPGAGMVLGLSVHTLGAVIPPGGKILDIVPQNEKLIVEARVSPLDVDQVRPGQSAEVRFSSFTARNTAKIEGQLVRVSADRLVDEEQGTSYYLARVEISNEGVQELARNKLQLLPGMPAEVMIKTSERTLLAYLTSPLTDTFARSFREE